MPEALSQHALDSSYGIPLTPLGLLDSFALFLWCSLQKQDGKTRLNSDWPTILMLDVQNEFRWDKEQGICGMASEVHAQAFLCFAEPLFGPQSQQTNSSQSLTVRSLLPLSLPSVLSGGPHGWPRIIYLHSEFIRNHPVSLATGVICICCHSVYHTSPGSSPRTHSLQASVAGAVGVPPSFLTHQ